MQWTGCRHHEDARLCLACPDGSYASLMVQVLGCAALFGTILPFVELPFPAETQAHSYSRDIKVPFMKVRVGAG